MRLLGFLLFVAGLVLSFGNTSIFGTNFLTEFQNAIVYENGLSKPFEIELNNFSGPLGIAIEMEEGGKYVPGSAGAALTIIAENNGRAVWTNAISFNGAKSELQLGATSLTYKAYSMMQEPIGGRYKFSVNQGDVDDIAVLNVKLILQSSLLAKIPFVSTIGTFLIWLGAALFVFGLRRRSRSDANAPPPPAKWGRGS